MGFTPSAGCPMSRHAIDGGIGCRVHGSGFMVDLTVLHSRDAAKMKFIPGGKESKWNTAVFAHLLLSYCPTAVCAMRSTQAKSKGKGSDVMGVAWAAGAGSDGGLRGDKWR